MEEEAGGESASKAKKRTYRSPEVIAGANDKWDWLYKVGVKKVMDQKKAGRVQDDIVFEREKEQYTFHPNKASAVKKKDEEGVTRNQQIEMLTRARTYQAPIPKMDPKIKRLNEFLGIAKPSHSNTKGPKPSANS